MAADVPRGKPNPFDGQPFPLVAPRRVKTLELPGLQALEQRRLARVIEAQNEKFT
jgi:hypothetical protein